MSVYQSALQNSDPFLMTQKQVNEAIAAFFIKNGSSVTFAETGSEVDVIANIKSIKFYIESRGNQALKYAGTDKVFDSSQISIHIAEQIEQTMRFQQQFDNSKRAFFIIGNPDIKRIRERISRIDRALDKLGIIQAWVQGDGSVNFEGENAIILDIGLQK